MEKLFIKNRKNQNIAVIIEKSENQKGLSFVMHGLSGNKNEPQIETFAKAFRDNNFTVIRFDTTNTFGESDGNYEDATVTNYYEDLEDVINRAKTQDFYEEPFVLCGQSLGSMCTALYAENFPEKVKALAPISLVISGKMSLEIYPKEMVAEREKSWRRIQTRSNGSLKKLKRGHMIDRLNYDILPKSNVLTMPVLMLVWELDDSTPAHQQKILFDSLSWEKELHIIKDAPHTFKDPRHLEEIYQIFDKRIKKIQ